jgi:crossover junction endodeoxyribonuclease RuvC
MVVLGIDPGLANTGFGVVVARGSRLTAADAGVIRTLPTASPERRLAELHEGCARSWTSTGPTPSPSKHCISV